MSTLPDHKALRTAAAQQSESHDWLSLSQSLRRMSHEYGRDAIEAEADGKPLRVEIYLAEKRRLWKASKWYLRMSRRALALGAEKD